MKNKIKLIGFALLLVFIGSVGNIAAKPANTPEQSAKSFYQWYVKELKKDGGNPIDDKDMLGAYVSKRLIKQIQEWRDAEEYDTDYFINAQDFDETWRVSTTNAVVVKDTATLKVALKSARPKGKGFSQNLTMSDLRMMRNEFWARRGRAFSTPFFKQNFEWHDWYKPLKDQSKVKLNSIEEKNVKLIEAEEAKLRNKISTEPLTKEMIEGLFIEDLRVLRNEIYAKHGRVFKDKELQKYFAAQSWYQPNPDFKDENLSETESNNLAVIKEVEEFSISRFAAAEA